MTKIKIKFKIKDKYVLNMCKRKGIDIYSIDNDIYTVDKSNLNKIPSAYIKKTYNLGLDYIIAHLKSNIYFYISILISLIIVLITTNMVFKIDVKHSDKKIKTIITDELYRYGVKPISFKKNYERLDYIKDKILEDYPENIEWLEIIDRGMSYEVRVEERIITKEKKEPTYCNLVSTKDAIIDSMEVEKGDIVLMEGDAVKKGDIIVSGDVFLNDESKGHVCSKGLVYGTTWYKVHISMPYSYIYKKKTGNITYNIGIKLNNKYITLFKNKYKYCDSYKEKLVKIDKLTLYKEKLIEYIPIKRRYKKDEIDKIMVDIAASKLRQRLDRGIILDEKVLQSTSYNSIMEADIFFVTREVISERKKE